MKPSIALEQYRAAIVQAAKRYGMLDLRVFGSTARDEDREESDLDILVTLPKDASLLSLGGFVYQLNQQLPIEVHVTTLGSIPLPDRPQIIAESKTLL